MLKLLIALQRLNYFPLAFSGMLLFGLLTTTAFVGDITIENRSAEEIAVTPLGAIRGSEQPDARYGLPIVVAELFPFPSARNGDYRLAPGESVTILYDWDDIQFTDVVVENTRGDAFQLVVGSLAQGLAYTRPDQDCYVIEDLSRLPPASATAREAAAKAKPSGIGVVLILAAVLVVPWLIHGGLTYVIPRRRPTPLASVQVGAARQDVTDANR